MDDKLNEIRERYGRQRLPRLFSGAGGDNRSEIRERYLGTGIAFGAGFGMVIGAGLGVAFGTLALGIGFGVCLGTGSGIAIGLSLDSKHAKRGQESSDTDGSRNAEQANGVRAPRVPDSQKLSAFARGSVAALGSGRDTVLKTTTLRTVLIVLCLLCEARATDAANAVDIINSEGEFVFIDGSSYFRFGKDGQFDMSPLSISGREVHGTWSVKDDHLFVIEGTWGWVNGISPTNDRRRMVISIQAPFTVLEQDQMPHVMKRHPKVYRCYFTIEELISL